MLPQEIIRRKRDGHELTPAEIADFVHGATSGRIAQGQIGAFTMAVYLRGMTRAERVALALAMRDSGEVLDWSAHGLPAASVIDKHSSGGVGDEKVSLLVAPMAAACGVFMPMVSARGLGHTGGEIDLLDVIPGYDIAPSVETFQRVVQDVGCAVIGPTPRLAPADAAIYYVRDVTATVESIPLITGSIMAKKLAAGVGGLVMSVNFGSGAFMPEVADARALAESLLDVATGAGVRMVALLGDMGQVVGHAVGNALEVVEAIDYLTGRRREQRLHDLAVTLAAEAVLLAGRAADLAGARAAVLARLDDGSAAGRFARMVAALGGPADLIERPDRYLERAPLAAPVFLDAAGIVQAMDARAIGLAMVALGAGRAHPEAAIDAAVGLAELAPVGAAVGPGRALCILHARDADGWDRAAAAIRAAVALGPAAPLPAPTFRDRLDNLSAVAPAAR